MKESSGELAGNEQVSQSTEINGVKFFGKVEGPVKPDEVEKVQINFGNEVYLLKHFSKLSDQDTQKYIGQTTRVWGKETVIDQDFIDKQLKASGSKFNQEIPIFSSPDKAFGFVKKHLIQALNSGMNVNWIKKDKFKDCSIQFDITKEDKALENIPSDASIGTCPLIEITPEIQANLVQESRSGLESFVVNKVKGLPVPSIDSIVVALRWFDNNDMPQINTFYPGVISPAFPDSNRQNSEEFAANKVYWDKHAFIIE